MRYIFTLLMFLWLPWGSHSTVCGSQLRAQPQPLVLTAKILSQQYCSVNSNVDNLQIRVQLQFKNAGNQRLILYNGHDLFYQIRIRRVASSATTEKYEVNILNSRYFDERPEKIDQPAPGKVFVILPPGAVYQTEMLVGLGVVGSGVNRGNDALRDGEHSLQLTVSTWYKSRNLAQKLRQQWQRKGLLWFEPLVSTPVNFMVESPHARLPCR